MAAQLATAAQLASALGESDLDAGTADLALARASALVRAVSRQQIDYVPNDTVTLVGGERSLLLPEFPVDESADLTVVELGDFAGAVDFTAVENVDYTRVGNELTRGWPYWWATTSRTMGWPYNRPRGVWAPRVRVTYSHGYTTIPDDIVDATLTLAVSAVNNPTLLRSEQVDDYSVTYATETLGSTVVDGLRRRLAVAGRRRGSFSVRLT